MTTMSLPIIIFANLSSVQIIEGSDCIKWALSNEFALNELWVEKFC